MIKFSQKIVKKSEVLDLIDNELLCIEVRLTFQKKLNEQVLSYLKSFMNNNYSTNDHEKISTMSDYLNNASRILKRSSTNLSKFENLQEKLSSMHEYFCELEKPSSNVIKTQLEDYNKKYTETIEKTEPATSEIQAFLAQCEQDDILQELLLEKELEKKAAEFVNKISNIQIQPIFDNVAEQSQEKTNQEITTASEVTSKESETKSNNIISEQKIQTIENTSKAEEIKNNSNVIKETPSKAVESTIIVETTSNETTESATKAEATPNETAETTTETENTTNETADAITETEEISNKIADATTETEKATNANIESTTIAEEHSLFEVNNFNNQAISKIIIDNMLNKNEESADKKTKILENTLIISEKNGNVILPYTIEKLNSALEKNPSKYKSLEDVVEKKYTIPIKYYKNSSVARFKETFKLVRERNKGPLKYAWDLALESFFNHDLHPAIISACKSIDELDIYLSCLEYDELEDFKFFKIIFDVLPTLNRKKKVST